MDVIVRDSKLPYYQQLYEILRDKIARGEWQPGDLIPSESDLIDQYGVSRITARKALETLVNESLIYRERGRGTFVAHPTVEQGLVRIVSFTEDMRQRGLKAGTEVLSSGLVPAAQDIAEELGIEVGEELAYIERLRLADDEPMSLEEAHLVHRYCEGVLKHNYARHPLRQMLANEFGIQLTHARQVIRAVKAGRQMGEKLSVGMNAALLQIERVSYAETGVPVEFLRVWHRGDRYALYNELQG